MLKDIINSGERTKFIRTQWTFGLFNVDYLWSSVEAVTWVINWVIREYRDIFLLPDAMRVLELLVEVISFEEKS